jgi:hypothetical protein
MSYIAFGLKTTWGEYSVDFDEEGKMIRNQDGDIIDEEYEEGDEATYSSVEELLGVIAIGPFDNEEAIAEKRNKIAKQYQVHPERIKVLYLDESKEVVI